MIDRLQENRRIDLFQLALTVLASPFLVIVILQSAQRDFTSAETLLITLTFVVFLARVRYPEIALVAQVILAVGLARFSDSSSDDVARGVLTVCLMSVAVTRGRVAVVVSTAVVLATTFGIAWHYGLENDGSGASLTDYGGLIAQAAAAVGIGTAIRIQRQYIAEIRDRADRERRNREIDVRQSITEERLRIARELHDAVAHHIAVVSMFLGLARTTARDSPEKTEQTLASAQEATRSVLSELQQILQLLREPTATEAEMDPPVPGLADIDVLVEEFRGAGMPVQLTRAGMGPVVSTQVGLAVYRLAQEALTNANKHGTGITEVRLTYGEHDLSLEVDNAVSPGRDNRAFAGASRGLVGMGERVRLLGGTLNHGEVNGGFRVIAKLPLGVSSADLPRFGDAGSRTP
ncbi:MAG: sensor histidine kinase [Thermomicrobiales bacterium]